MKRRFTGKTKFFLGLSGAIILVALVMQICGAGLNLGVDFTGGSILKYSVGEAYDINDVSTILNAAGYEGSQITKAEPSAASIALQAELAQQAAEAAEATAEEGEEAAAEETATEETAEEEASETLLNMDKSGIEDDGLTDLQLRLKLVDETEGLEEAIEAAVKAQLPNAQKQDYQFLTNSLIVNKGYTSSFAGGYVAEFEAGEEFDSAAIQEAIQAALAEEYSIEAISVQRYDAEAEVAAAEEATEEASEAVAEETTEEEVVEESGTALRVLITIDDQASQVRALLESEMTAKYANFRFVSIDHVSAIAGRDLIGNAVKALLIAFACMLVYIAIRFDVFSGLAALFALLHDVLIMCAFMVFFRGIFQANSSFIAAILTIVGYSINNTIIIFDRIRELAKKPGNTAVARMDIVEDAVGNTLSRTINTSLTTLITLVALYIFGVESIREFAFPLIVGMVAGTYSSVMLSGQVWAMWMEKYKARKAAKNA